VCVTFAVHVYVSWLFGLEEVGPVIRKVRGVITSTIRVQ